MNEARPSRGARAAEFPDPGRQPPIASWYEATAHPQPRRPRLEGDLAVDVAIVGAGYTGLSAALDLAERGYRVAVVEAERVGWGASGRNGGQVITGFNPSLGTLVARYGRAPAQALFALAEAGKAQLRQRITRYDIACDLRWGFLAAALKPRQLRELEAEAALLQDFGYRETELRSEQAVRDLVRSPRYIGGLYDRGSGHLHPLNYALGLARAAESAGAQLFEGSPVTGYEPGAAVVLRTPHGRLRASFVLLCGNAYQLTGFPPLARRVMPVASCLVSTERLTAPALGDLLTQDIAVADCNHILDYFRGTPDGRLIFGGLARYSGHAPAAIGPVLQRRLRRVFPQLGDIRLEHAWSGLVAITRNRLPYLGRLTPNILFALGYSGHGVILAGLSGSLLAEAVAGSLERFDIVARLPHRPFPGGPLRTPALIAAMLYFRLRDLL